MNENAEYNSMNAERDLNRELLIKWLRILFQINIVGIVLSALSVVPGLSTVTEWVSRVVGICVIVVLFRLAPANDRYRKSAVFYAVSLACALLNVLLGAVNGLLGISNLAGSVITLAASVCSIIADYQQYYAHADVIAEKDPKLSGNWHSLFTWQIIVGVLLSFASILAVVIGVLLSAETTVLTAVVIGVLTGMSIILQVIYLVYLNRMLRLLRA